MSFKNETVQVQLELQTYPYLDFFKALGLLCVILAHVDAPRAVVFFRSFDVPFLVMISASLASLTDRNERYISYVWKRVKRLILPAWLYLAFCTIVFAVLKVKSPSEMLPSFLFRKYQFGFVWIIFLYFVMALTVPLLRRIFANCTQWRILKKTMVAMLLIWGGVMFELICINTDLYSISIMEYTFFYVVPYGIVSIFGIIAVKVQRKWLFALSVFFIVITAVCSLCLYHTQGLIVRPDAFTQPARFYYISFCLAVGFLFYALFRDRNWKLFSSPVIVFLSRHSLWIYLWHSFVNLIVFKISDFWLLRYVMTIAFSCLIVFAQNLIVNCIQTESRAGKEVLKFFKG